MSAIRTRLAAGKETHHDLSATHRRPVLQLPAKLEKPMLVMEHVKKLAGEVGCELTEVHLNGYWRSGRAASPV